MLTLLPLFSLTACEVHFEQDAVEELSSICGPVIFEQSPFTHCIADPTQHEIGTDLAPEGSEEPYRSLRAFASTQSSDSQPVVFAANAGMFDEAGLPIGYFVEAGRRVTVLNQRNDTGNFYLKPNGVFFGDSASGPWQVWETTQFARVGERPFFATQSGPMLVVNGELHPEIAPNGSSLRIRNAVGVDRLGRAHFVASEAPVSLGKLARYYRDVLNVPNALYLDGTVSQMWDTPNGRLDSGEPIGPLIVVRIRAEETQ